MSDRPILFSAPMVRALLAGTKTQTRRAVRPQPDWVHEGGAERRSGADFAMIRCPYGVPGDRLWVRETWTFGVGDCGHRDDGGPYRYGADGGFSARWRPSIHMPRVASRITLEVTGVRVERLQAISEADCMAEGVQGHPLRPDDGWPICTGFMVGADDGKTTLHPKPQDAYRRLWESINGAGSWAANPWVWVVEFKRAA